MPVAVQAGLWGLLSGSALVVGAAIAFFVDLSQRWIAAIMAFGAGVLISALSFELMDEAYKQGGFLATSGGFLGGAAIYTAANIIISHRGGAHRKRSGSNPTQSQKDAGDGGGLAIAVGALLDGIPESIVIGLSLLGSKGVSLVAVIAIFLSNIPEGLSSSAGMRKAGRSALYIFGVWTAIAVASGLASLVGYMAFAGAPPQLVAAITAVAAGAILAMLSDTMMPEAFETVKRYIISPGSSRSRASSPPSCSRSSAADRGTSADRRRPQRQPSNVRSSQDNPPPMMRPRIDSTVTPAMS